jgi:hypothetical protein
MNTVVGRFGDATTSRRAAAAGSGRRSRASEVEEEGGKARRFAIPTPACKRRPARREARSHRGVGAHPPRLTQALCRTGGEVSPDMLAE